VVVRLRLQARTRGWVRRAGRVASAADPADSGRLGRM